MFSFLPTATLESHIEERNKTRWKEPKFLTYCLMECHPGESRTKTSTLDIAYFAKSLQLCPTLCNPIDGSLPGSPSLGFSRQEHWSGLPFPSPMHESEKWKWSRSVVSDSSWSHGLQPTRLLRPWDFPGKSTGVGCHCLLLGYSLSEK